MRKKLLSILLTLALLLSLIPAGYAADIEIVDEPDIVISADDALMIDGAEIHVNPLYRDQISAEEVAASLREAAGTDAVTYSCGSIEEAAAALREGMKARETDVTIRYTGSESFDYRAVLDLAMAHTGNPTEGDYLRFQYGGWSIRYSSTEYRYQLTYYTTAEQEAELDAAVSSALNGLSLGGKTEYQKIRAVYDFICANTVYDYDHLGDSSYNLQFTAYAAMINKTSVCQGYANLLYRMLLSVGVDTRIVTSETHAWNIVKIGDLYYNVDSTWDAGNNGNYSWFLKCMDHFTGDDHVREAPYSEDAFLTEYPMSPTDYSEGDNPITLEKEELTLYLGGDPATIRFTIDPTYDYSYVSFSYTGGGLFSITGNSYSVTITPLKAGGGVVNVLLKDEDGGTLAKATIYVTVLESAPESITGQCGENLFWTLDDQGTLTITGTGDMWDSTGAQGYGGAWSAYGAQIRTVIIEDGATSIGAESFKNCDQITSVVIPDSLLVIDNQAFLNCSALENLSLGEGLVGIGYESFSGCSSLQSVRLPDSVTRLSLGVFGYCSSLRSVSIGSGLQSFYASDFYFCNKLTELTVSEDNPYYRSVDSVIFTKDGTELVCCPNGRAGEYRIPDGTAVVKAGAFANCAALTGLAIPDSVTEIGGFAFENCGSLTGIRFEGNAPTFGERCFENVTATAYYPAFDRSWTDEVRQDYGGHITWVGETGDGLPVDEEHFPDEIFCNYVAEEFDGDGNGYLNDEEIAAITEIDVSMMGISSLQGIEYFPELTSLTCSMNSLTELDVTHNPALIWLDCFGNELTKLDLSGNPVLEDLDCSDNNLTALDVTRNPALTMIECSENAITALDVTHNPALEGLFCYGNEIAALDLSGNAELIVLDCSTNALTELDLSGNSGLVMLECYGNDIAELDLSPCPTLVDIVTNGKYEEPDDTYDFDRYTNESGHVYVDPTTKLITEAQPGDGFTITVTDYTNGAAQTSLDLDAKYSGSVTFTVTSTDDKAVLVAVKNSDDDDASYQVAKCVTEGGVHTFTITVKANTTVALAFKGDADLDGIIEGLDGTMIKRVALETFTYDTKLKELVSDIDSNGIIAALEGTMVCRAALETYTLPWSNP